MGCAPIPGIVKVIPLRVGFCVEDRRPALQLDQDYLDARGGLLFPFFTCRGPSHHKRTRRCQQTHAQRRVMSASPSRASLRGRRLHAARAPHLRFRDFIDFRQHQRRSFSSEVFIASSSFSAICRIELEPGIPQVLEERVAPFSDCPASSGAERGPKRPAGNKK